MSTLEIDKLFTENLSDNDKNTIHRLNVLLGICNKHNDVFTDEERQVLGMSIGMWIGTFESETMQKLLTEMVVEKWYDQLRKGRL